MGLGSFCIFARVLSWRKLQLAAERFSLGFLNDFLPN